MSITIRWRTPLKFCDASTGWKVGCRRDGSHPAANLA